MNFSESLRGFNSSKPATSFSSNYYDDEDQDETVNEDSVDYGLGDDMSEASSDEFIDDETLQLSLFETALKKNNSFKKKLTSNPGFKRNKLLTELTYNQSEVIGQSETLMSLNEEFAKKLVLHLCMVLCRVIYIQARILLPYMNGLLEKCISLRLMFRVKTLIMSRTN